MPRRRGQQGRVYKRGKRWAGSYRDYEINPRTGKRSRRTITFDDSVSSRVEAIEALQPYLDDYNAKAKAQTKTSAPPKGGSRTVSNLIEEWKKDIIPNRKVGAARTSLSHVRTYVIPLLGNKMLRELTVREHQAFVTAIGQRVSRRRTTQNVYGTLTSILNRGRRWGYFIPEVRRQDVEFPTDQTPKSQPFFFDADTASRIINISPNPFKLMFLVAAVCGLRIGEVTALKRSNLDFKRKLIHITAALDYATRKESTPKSSNSAAPLHMTALLGQHLRNWVDKHFRPNPGGYLFLNSRGRPFPSDNVVKYGIHRAIAKLGIQTQKGVHVGIHCFRHGVTTELLESGTPIHIVTKLMRHGDSKVTLDHYAHVVGAAERAASERFSQKIGLQLESDPELESTFTANTA